MLTLDAQTTYVRNGSFEDYYRLPYRINNETFILTTCIGDYNTTDFPNNSYPTTYSIPILDYRPNEKNPSRPESGCDGWFNPGYFDWETASPDYYHRLAGDNFTTGADVDIPKNYSNNYGYTLPFHGQNLQQAFDDDRNGTIDTVLNKEQGYIGILSQRLYGAPGSTDYEWQEYVCQRLENPLIAGQCYEVSMKISLAPIGLWFTAEEKASFYLTDFGAFFTNQFVSQTNNQPFNYTPYEWDYINRPNMATINDPNFCYYKDKGGSDGLHWMEIVEKYRPLEDKNFIYIGNFVLDWEEHDILKEFNYTHDPTIDLRTLSSNLYEHIGVYYYVDSVSIKRIYDCDTCRCEREDTYSEVLGYTIHWEKVDPDNCCFELFVEPTCDFWDLCLTDEVNIYRITNPNYNMPPDPGDLQFLENYEHTDIFRPDYTDPNMRKTSVSTLCFDQSDYGNSIELYIEYLMDGNVKCTYVY